MKLTILKREFAFQVVLSIIAIIISLYFKFTENDLTSLMIFLITLLIVGISNIIGLLIRTFYFKNKLNKIYAISVIVFFSIGYIIFSIEDYFGSYIIGIGSVILNIFYLCCGYYTIKNYQKIPLKNKS